MTMELNIDYASTGLDICAAKLDMASKYPDKSDRPDFVLWNGLHVKTADQWRVPVRGRVRIEILSSKPEVEQGIDFRVDMGAVKLAGGEEVSLLRTWADDRYEGVVEYPYYSQSGDVFVSNVYKIALPNGQKREEKWTGNAGCVIDSASSRERIYHCSHGVADRPDFDSLVFRVTILPEE